MPKILFANHTKWLMLNYHQCVLIPGGAREWSRPVHFGTGPLADHFGG